MAALIPKMMLRQLYTYASLENVAGGVQFALKNRLSDAALVEVLNIKLNEHEVPPSALTLILGEEEIAATAVTADNPLPFALRQVVQIRAAVPHLPMGKHTVEINVNTQEFGQFSFDVEDAISASDDLIRIPRDAEDNYSEKAIKERQKFVEEITGATLNHTAHYSFDPHILKGNVENFTGVAQIPIGFAGPLTIHGEHAKGDFIVPLATTEGTLVASYNRGMKLLNLSGGVTCTVIGDAMQRAPVFVFNNAREAREFRTWCEANMAKIREEAEATSSVAKLQYIDYFLSNKFAYLRFNYSTGDAAGQNMVGRATFAACSWILDNYDDKASLRHFFLESNLATDKKASQVNVMRTRGKRVVAEATIPRDVLIQNMRVTPENLTYHAGVANVGAILSGANNNGLHSANGITAMFIATGQDVANVSESSAGIIYAELTPEKDLYISITIPSLIVATHGGGTGLATQRECLQVLGCVGRGTVNKFAEIVAGVVLAGELSLAAAISSSDWVSSHEQYGRNR
ncbi:MAG: hydroxymethylglutaryl-CoA reductase [Chloroflexi bacterium]|nr:hydroxymethylglutaryl-CoA reductase [Chloroflexota bacterium]